MRRAKRPRARLRPSCRRRTTATPLPDATAFSVPPEHDEAALAASAADEDEPESGPLRRCAVTRERDYRARMVRFVVAPDRTVVPDLAAKLPGRGIWLSARRDVLDTAQSRGAFARAAKAAVSVPGDLTERVEAGLARRVTELLGLTRRAGQAVCGFEKARERLQAGRAGLVVQASDGSLEERARFLSGVAGVPVVAPLPASALGAVFGRDHVVHVVIGHGRLAEALAIEAERLAGVSGLTTEKAPAGHSSRQDMVQPGGRAARRGLREQAGR